MELKECITCGSHSFTNDKCDYCGNQYEMNKEPLTDKEQFMKEKYLEHKAGKVYCDNGIPDYTPEDDDELEKVVTSQSEMEIKLFKVMLTVLVSVIWFAVTVFIPPSFLITIAVLIILAVRKIIKKIRT